MALNDPRTIPYDFRVLLFNNEVFLYDDSSRTYPCSTTPHVYIEALYSIRPEVGSECPLCKCGTVQGSWDEDPRCAGECGTVFDGLSWSEPGYLTEAQLSRCVQEPVLLDPEDVAADVPRKDAWDAAREAAQANHCL